MVHIKTSPKRVLSGLFIQVEWFNHVRHPLSSGLLPSAPEFHWFSANKLTPFCARGLSPPVRIFTWPRRRQINIIKSQTSVKPYFTSKFQNMPIASFFYLFLLHIVVFINFRLTFSSVLFMLPCRVKPLIQSVQTLKSREKNGATFERIKEKPDFLFR
jgi:hypothetical protein